MKALRLAVLALLPLFVTTALLAQSSTTSVRGVVTDPSGAIVPGATVTISDTASGFTATRTTSGQGEFQFVQIAPGKYTFKASAAGFAVQTTVANLLVSQPATLNFKLSVNASTVTMDVSAAAETINLSDATIGNAVSSATIESLPTEARNVPSLLSLQPGVLFLGNDVGGGDSRNGVVSGARADQTNLSLDGLDNNQQLGGAAFTGVLRSTVDSVEEFRVTTSNSNADNGRSSGAQVNIVTKSGTNTFHGALYEYNRSNLGQANDWFNKQTQAASGLPNRPGKLIYNVYGATLGGPVKKDKFFFFLNYEGNRTLIGNQITQTVPTDALRAGNISYPHTDASGQTTNVSLTPSQIATTDPNCSANGTCPWGPGVDPNSVALFALYPHSNSFNSGDGYNTAAYSFSAPIPSVLETYIAKLDYNITSKNQLFVRGNLQNDLASSAPQFPGQPASSNNVDDTKGLAGGDTWALTNNLVNNARYAFIRQSFGNKGIGSGSFVNFRGFTPPVAETRSTVVNVPAQNFIDDLSWTHKSHTIQFGANWRLIHNNRTSDANSFSGATTNAFWLTGSKIANSGGSFDPAAFNLPSVDASFGTSYDFAISALAGLVDEETDTYNYHVSKDGKSGSIIAPGAAVGRQFKANEFEYYLQDAWRATPNLTFTFGLRHTILQTPYEING